MPGHDIFALVWVGVVIVYLLWDLSRTDRPSHGRRFEANGETRQAVRRIHDLAGQASRALLDEARSHERR